MNIYELNNKQMRKALKKFGNTNYGKVVFLLAYAIPTLLFFSLIAIVITLITCSSIDYLFSWKIQVLLLIIVCTFLLSFIIGSTYFYHELKEFINYSNKKSN